MENLLNIFIDTILPIGIIIVALISGIILARVLKKKFDKPLEPIIKTSSTPNVKLKETYCTEEEMIFLEALHKSLPRDCIAFPHVGVSKLLEPKGNLNDYKLVQDKFVDVCVFMRKDMKPILVIDLFQSSPIAQQLKKFDTNVSNVLKVVKIPVLHKEIKETYNTEELLLEVLNQLDGTTIALLKTKNIDLLSRKK